jgi:protein-L-isoaspartate(D-aspartate) O-methyltransferase
MPDLGSTRRAYAHAIAEAADLRTPGLEDALATVPRERFLPPGPWLVIGAGDARKPPALTPDADPVYVYQDASIAIDPDRQLFNGAPSFLARMIDLLALTRGSRVLHVGAATGYYSAVMAHVVGPSGRIVATEVDEVLASDAAITLSAIPWAEARHSDSTHVDGPFDAILVNAGVTHPQESWLEALAPGGRILLPMTVAMPAMGPALGKGVMVLISKTADGALVPEVLSFVGIYSAIGLRDAAIEAALGQAMRRTSFPNLTRLRRDAHPHAEGCWLHTERFCLSMEPVQAGGPADLT